MEKAYVLYAQENDAKNGRPLSGTDCSFGCFIVVGPVFIHLQQPQILHQEQRYVYFVFFGPTQYIQIVNIAQFMSLMEAKSEVHCI